MYNNKIIVLTSKHNKHHIIAPIFKQKLQAEIVACELDTDKLGTFSGEIARKGTALDCAKIKCEWGINYINCDYGLASEGSFGPHPSIPFLPCDHEILYFIDRINGIHLYETLLSEKTNYKLQTIQSIEQLHDFAQLSLFPSHALIIRPNQPLNSNYIFKGITSFVELELYFVRAKQLSLDHSVRVETDMRAHMNPSRMLVIKELAIKLSERLATPCPVCAYPGWGKTSVEPGLECESCGLATDLVRSEIYSCNKCCFVQKKMRSDNLSYAQTKYCAYCNP